AALHGMIAEYASPGRLTCSVPGTDDVVAEAVRGHREFNGHEGSVRVLVLVELELYLGWLAASFFKEAVDHVLAGDARQKIMDDEPLEMQLSEPLGAPERRLA